MHAHIHGHTCLRHTRTHTRSNATVVTGFCSSFPLAEFPFPLFSVPLVILTVGMLTFTVYPSVCFYAFSIIFSVPRDQNGQVFPGIFVFLRSWLQQKNDSELLEKAAASSLQFGPFCFQMINTHKLSRFWHPNVSPYHVKYSTFHTKSTLGHDASCLLTSPVKMSG